MKLSLMALIVILLFAGTGFAQTSTDPVSLHLVYPQKSSLKNPVTVQFTLKDQILHVNFEVHTAEIYAQKSLLAGEYPYQYDVVEVFISVNNNSQNLPIPYYEFELSPYNQSLQVKIIVPLKQVVLDVDMGIKHSTQRFSGGWRGEISIPMENLGWNGDPCKIIGNAYAILGKPPRSFWSLYLPPEPKPNFHKPQYFKPILCK